MAISALISYHVAHILIHTDLSAILRAAGIADVAALNPTKEERRPNQVGQEARSHAMNIIRLSSMNQILRHQHLYKGHTRHFLQFLHFGPKSWEFIKSKWIIIMGAMTGY